MFLDNHNSQSAIISISGTTNLYTKQTDLLIDIDISQILLIHIDINIFSKVSIYRQSICHIDISNRASIKQMRFCIKVCFLSPSVYLGIGLVWDNLSNPFTTTHFLVRLLKSSSNWTKLSMMGPQLFSGWYQMILDVFRCNQLLSDVLCCFLMFSAWL